MAAGDVKLELTNRNWDSLNAILNDSPELSGMLDSIQKSIMQDTLANIAGSGSRLSAFTATNATTGRLEPNSGNKVRQRFVNIPGVGFETRYSPLSKALEANRGS